MQIPAPCSKVNRWLWIASIWLGIALFSALQYVLVLRTEGMHYSWPRLVTTLLLSWLVWVLATPLVLRLGSRFPPVRFRPVSHWLVHLAAWSVLGVASATWETLLLKLLNPMLKHPAPGPFRSLWVETVYNEVLLYLSLYAALLAISYILESRERLVRQQIETARLNEQFSKAQLDALRNQIEPHFLFNALNAIAGLVREHRDDAAVKMIVGLSEFLRKVVETSGRHEVPLGEEVQFLQKYLEIQKVRFADRLQLSVDIPLELSAASVPSLILQPIAENAIKHGIAREEAGGWIRISASRANGWLSLRVYNDGPGLPANWDNSHSGIGIANLRNRLRAMFGEEFQLSLRNRDAGVEVLISVPFRENGK
ncbi:MAG TPA: histidine kinase [Candidatus Acidoferrales bacterium]|nr:histidine kinase [Candidatus Acidoferrales bacterium]